MEKWNWECFAMIGIVLLAIVFMGLIWYSGNQVPSSNTSWTDSLHALGY